MDQPAHAAAIDAATDHNLLTAPHPLEPPARTRQRLRKRLLMQTARTPALLYLRTAA